MMVTKASSKRLGCWYEKLLPTVMLQFPNRKSNYQQAELLHVYISMSSHALWISTLDGACVVSAVTLLILNRGAAVSNAVTQATVWTTA